MTQTERPTLAFVERLARDAGKLILQFYDQPVTVTTKAHPGDFLTQADIAANALIIGEITKSFPQHAIISEETGTQTGSEWTWIVDPIDGTRNFATHTPFFGVMISVAYKGTVELAVIHMPLLQETLVAERGKGAYLNGVQVHCVNTSTIDHSYATVSSSLTTVAAERMLRIAQSVPRLQFGSLGCNAANTLYVATGRRDWTLSTGGGVWDYAAGSLIFAEAGAIMTTLTGAPWTLSDDTVLAANPTLHAKLLQILKEK